MTDVHPVTDLKDQTLHIRMAGADAPEVGHSHPFSVLH